MPDAKSFFPKSEAVPDLYEVLSLSKTASESDIKSAYRRSALTYHPDKLPPNSTPEEVESGNLKFQQVGFAYSILKDPKRRARYDENGNTDDAGEGAKTEAEWRDYFKELWSGEVNAETLDEFKLNYQGSEEERTDLLNVYESSEGDLELIFGAIMCSTFDDEDRFMKLINDSIAAGTSKSYPQWKKTTKDLKAKEKRKAMAESEATEAEEYAKELGVYEKLYGDKSKGSSSKGRGKATKKTKEDDEAGLRALIQGNQARRMENMLDSLEAKYGAKDSSKKGKKRTSNGGAENENLNASGKKKKVEEPSEEEFAKIQAEMDARRAAKTSSGNGAQKSKGRK